MKKIVQTLLMVSVLFLSVQSGYAKDKVWSDEAFDLSSVHRLLILEPNYYLFKDGASVEDIVNMFQTEGASNMYVLTKAEMETNILRDAKIDLKTLDAKKAQDVFDEHMKKYVDAYMVATIVHNSRVVIVYEVYSAQTKQLIFRDEVLAGKSEKDSIGTYAKLTKTFYKDFQKEAKAQAKKRK